MPLTLQIQIHIPLQVLIGLQGNPCKGFRKVIHRVRAAVSRTSARHAPSGRRGNPRRHLLLSLADQRTHVSHGH